MWHAAHPNPFDPFTSIPFELSERGTIRLIVYDLPGHRISVFADRSFEALSHVVHSDANGPPSGLYMVALEQDGRRPSHQITLLR